MRLSTIHAASFARRASPQKTCVRKPVWGIVTDSFVSPNFDSMKPIPWAQKTEKAVIAPWTSPALAPESTTIGDGTCKVCHSLSGQSLQESFEYLICRDWTVLQTVKIWLRPLGGFILVVVSSAITQLMTCSIWSRWNKSWMIFKRVSKKLYKHLARSSFFLCLSCSVLLWKSFLEKKAACRSPCRVSSTFSSTLATVKSSFRFSLAFAAALLALAVRCWFFNLFSFSCSDSTSKLSHRSANGIAFGEAGHYCSGPLWKWKKPSGIETLCFCGGGET